MQHFSCDLCGRDLTDGPGERYVVRVDVAPVSSSSCPADLTAADLDTDHVEAMAEMLQELVESGEHAALPPPPQAYAARYDLCGPCRAKFVADPLGRATRRAKPHFSKN